MAGLDTRAIEPDELIEAQFPGVKHSFRIHIAEEAFVCGTAAEVSSVNSVDDRKIPCPGRMTSAIAEVYHEAIRGKDPRYAHWCEHAT